MPQSSRANFEILSNFEIPNGRAFFMQTIKYKFADGTTSEIEVTDEIYSLHLQLLQEEKRNHWRETRRHISLNYLLENGVDFTDNAADSFAAVELRENEERIHNAINQLSDKQRELAQKVFFEGMTLTDIAKEKGVSQPAITQQLATVIKKLKKLLQKTL
jgi:RNA polymerase sigma factor (sigma-70 family)